MKPFFNHGLRAAVANTDKHGWGKDFDANCTNFREGVRGWMGVLAVRPPGTTRGRAARAPDGNEICEKGRKNAKIKPN